MSVAARPRPRILILHASVGAGHTRAARAVADALASRAPQAQVQVVDALELARPLFRRVYGEGYLGLVEHAPALFGLLYERTDRPCGRAALGDRLRRAVQNWGAPRLVEFLEKGRWDAVVHTHFLAPELCAASARAGRLSAPQLTVVTDYDAHRIWAGNSRARYCVAGAAAAASLRAHGVAADAIAVTGIPVDPAFARPSDQETARREFGLSGARPVVVLSAGGHGVGPLEEFYRALLACSTPSRIVAVCGRNEDARRRLTAIAPPPRHRALVLGYTDQMRTLMAAADLLVTKPGGLTVSEALAVGLPMALIRPIPGQEERNADFLLKGGAAVRAGSPAALTGVVDGTLSCADRLAELGRRALSLGRPRAAFDVAERVLRLAVNDGERPRALTSRDRGAIVSAGGTPHGPDRPR